MKNGGLFSKIVYWGNLLAATLLLISFVLPYLPPKTFPTLSLLSLVVSVLIIINIAFLLYWLVKLKRQLIISLTVLVISYFHFNVFYEISSEVENISAYKNTLNILTYNVHLFNAYEKNPGNEAEQLISEIIAKQNPDVICVQEYYKPNTVDFSTYPFQYIHFKGKNSKLGHAIFSKYPMLNTGAFDFEDSNNNTLFADVVKGEDTLRVYNLHLQSLGILPHVSFLQESDNDKLRRRLSKAFEKQQNQVEAILEHKKNTKHPVIICGDLNVAHKSIDLARPKANYNKSAGHMQEEIDGMDKIRCHSPFIKSNGSP